jgi:hypothetical protein
MGFCRNISCGKWSVEALASRAQSHAVAAAVTAALPWNAGGTPATTDPRDAMDDSQQRGPIFSYLKLRTHAVDLRCLLLKFLERYLTDYRGATLPVGSARCRYYFLGMRPRLNRHF